MKTYSFDAREFAELEFFLGKAVSFLHQERSKADLEAFQREFFPILRRLYYETVGAKIDDDQRDAISEHDPWDPEMPHERAIELLTKIFKQ